MAKNDWDDDEYVGKYLFGFGSYSMHPPAGKVTTKTQIGFVRSVPEKSVSQKTGTRQKVGQGKRPRPTKLQGRNKKSTK